MHTCTGIEMDGVAKLLYETKKEERICRETNVGGRYELAKNRKRGTKREGEKSYWIHAKVTFPI